MDWNLAEFRKPINLTFLGIAIVSLAVSVVTYLWSLHSASISYYTATIQIVDQRQAAPLPFSVIDSAGQRVTENVYAISVTIWNSGDLPIEPQNVRSPLTVSLASPARLIDAKLEYVTSENISEFKINGDPTKGGAAQISWRYFDPKEGLRLRLIYATNDISNVKIEGVIFGVNKFENITPPKKDTLSLKSPGLMQLIISAIFMMIAAPVVFSTRKRDAAKEVGNVALPRRATVYLLLLLAIGFQAWGILLAVYPPAPPF
jgi:hypothetical protein